MPNRVLRDWTDSDKVNQLSTEAEVFLVRLIMKADDFGRFHAEPNRLKSACYPLKDTIRSTDISRWLGECQAAGLIRCYEANGGRYMCIERFNQRLRQMRGKYPEPPVSQLTVNGQSIDRHSTDNPSIPFVSVSDSDSDGIGDWGKGPEVPAACSGVFERLKCEIGKHFNRKVTDRWAYDEEHGLAAVCRRLDAESEWLEIVAFRRVASRNDEKVCGSIRSQLEGWQGTLDRARTYKSPGFKPTAKTVPASALLTGIPADPESDARAAAEMRKWREQTGL